MSLKYRTPHAYLVAGWPHTHYVERSSSFRLRASRVQYRHAETCETAKSTRHHRCGRYRRFLLLSRPLSLPHGYQPSQRFPVFWLPTTRVLRSVRLGPLRRARWWCRTPAHTPLITASLLQPFARAHIQIAVQLGRRFLAMNKIAEAAAYTALAAVKTTACFAEICNGREFAVDGATSIPAAVQGVAGFLRVLLILEADVDVTDEI